jgi:hypothetical protein
VHNYLKEVFLLSEQQCLILDTSVHEVIIVGAKVQAIRVTVFLLKATIAIAKIHMDIHWNVKSTLIFEFQRSATGQLGVVTFSTVYIEYHYFRSPSAPSVPAVWSFSDWPDVDRGHSFEPELLIVRCRHQTVLTSFFFCVFCKRNWEARTSR